VARSRRRQDAYGKRARKEGFPARSVYKLDEIDRRVRLLRPGDRVLDLGAAPGSWLRFAAQRVGPQGRVVGIDLQELRTGLPPNAEFHVQDVHAFDPGEATFDVVLSDMAPATTGHRSTDQARSHTLFMAALAVAERTLRPGGRFCAKLFQGPDLKPAEAAVRERFDTARILRPRATRSESIEVFIVGLGRRAPEGPAAGGATPGGASK
jgi:23S rRNA (uridine2552-2'-O)-methyltransferase